MVEQYTRDERRAWIELSASALQHNLSRVKQSTSAQVIAVIKADAYGHGLEFAARVLQAQVDGFAVATLDEALKLRKLCPAIPITLLSGFFKASQIPVFLEQAICPVIFNLAQIDWLQAAGTFSADIWLKLDTGMGRLGIDPYELEPALARLGALGATVSLMSHFASADTPQVKQNEAQHRRFADACSGLHLARSFANSAAILSRPQDHYERVRPGIMLYGSSPFSDRSAAELDLHAVMSVYARLIDIKKLQRGQSVGYGAHWYAPGSCRIGIVSFGYGDGYPRVVSEQACVVIAGKRRPLVGRISMDSFAVLLEPDDSLQIGEPVEIWGNSISVDEVAGWAGTIGYELLCRLTPRAERLETK